ncbi:hypothetical protein ACIQGZ_14340 [Streptomyces sp. NPDC092296]|uniref:hypothetical protein n=1 Tax=Streptomyces sp. NPDC092296 TaxID=3366012 RepID=UPI00382045AD
MTHTGRYRWRTRLRRRLPRFLVDRGAAGTGTRDCGAHEWYNHDGPTRPLLPLCPLLPL